MTSSPPRPTLTSDEVSAALKTLVANGLTFSHCVSLLGEDSKDSPYVRAAIDIYARDAVLEIDDRSIVSESEDGGAYVMAWRWVGDDELTDEERWTLTRKRACPTCEGDGWVHVHSESPPAFEACPECHNPEDLPCP